MLVCLEELTQLLKYLDGQDSTRRYRHTCQCFKMTNKWAYGKLPLNPHQRNKMPWKKVQHDCHGPRTIKNKNGMTNMVIKFEIWLLSMVDLGSSWSKLAWIATALATAMEITFDKQWLCRYPHPKVCNHNNGNEFLGWEFQGMLTSYSIKNRPITVKNPTADTIVERIHGTLSKQLHATIFGQLVGGRRQAHSSLHTCDASHTPFNKSILICTICIWMWHAIHAEGDDRLGDGKTQQYW